MRRWLVLLGVVACGGVWGQMVTGSGMPGYGEALGLTREQIARDVTAQFIRASAPGNVLWPGDRYAVTFQVVNAGREPVAAKGSLQCIPYGTKGQSGDIWVPRVIGLGVATKVPCAVDLAPGAFVNLTLAVPVPERLGAYAMVLDLPGHGRRFVTSCVRTFRAETAPVEFPQLCLDVSDTDVLTRLGAYPNRVGIGYKPTTDKDFDEWWQRSVVKPLEGYRQAKLPVTVEIGGGAFNAPEQPMGRPRPWLDDKGVMLDTKFDLAWLPSYDNDFRAFVDKLVSAYGWPRGPMNGIKLWNEPWEGISISGWGADLPRYREIFGALCEATDAARKREKLNVLIGGCDSSSNTFDKLFGDGSDDFLKYLDFVSIHYQGMFPPSTVKAWADRKGPNGRVKVWDTESWVANVDDRVAAVIATNLSTGHDRAVGIYGGNIATEWHSTGAEILAEGGKRQRIDVVHAWSVAASVGAANHFIGERRFKGLLFKNGLPWVMAFHGLPRGGAANPEDGTVVVVGDIGEEFGSDSVMFRTARGLAELKHKAELRTRLAELPADAAKERAELETALAKDEPLTGGSLSIADGGGRFRLYDFYGNPVPATNGRITVPLDHRGFYLRADGKPGSFEALLTAIKLGRTDGIEALATVCHDLTEPIVSRPTLRLELTNVLNRPLRGKLELTVAGLALDYPAQLAFGRHETLYVPVKVTGGSANAANSYPLSLRFRADDGAVAEHDEVLHVNHVSRAVIAVDGQLDDWDQALPQTIAPDNNRQPTLTEAAWFPFRNFDTSLKGGFATGWLAYDDHNLYFAAKVADSTPDEGMPRFETLNPDEYFYPEVSYSKEAAGGEASDFSARWTGKVRTKGAGDYTFTTRSDDGVRLWVDGKLLVDNWTGHGPTDDKDTLKLAADTSYDLKLEYFQGGGGCTLSLSWEGPGLDKQIIPTEQLRTATDMPGLDVEFFRGNDLKNSASRRVDAVVDYPTFSGNPNAPDFGKPRMALKEYRWPAGVRRYSYRKDPELPAGNAPNHDNIQLGFNVLPSESKPWYSHPAGTMPGYIGYYDTDYEYALNPVAERYGGGTEIWRLRYPGMPAKHFYPRQGASPLDGPAKGGKLVIRRDGNTRLVECSLPWTEIPAVKAAVDGGQFVKFSFRVNDNAGGGCMELARRRSVAKRNGSFHVDWAEHWANEVEFGFGK